MEYSVLQNDSTVAEAAFGDDTIEWRSRYDGLVAIAQIGDKAVAGISGPWSGKFALTWWERPLPARQLELFDSLEDAKQEVEDWALRMRTGGCLLVGPSSTVPISSAGNALPADAPVGLVERVRTLLPPFARTKPHHSASETIERLRRSRTVQDMDISGLHFAANE